MQVVEGTGADAYGLCPGGSQCQQATTNAPCSNGSGGSNTGGSGSGGSGSGGSGSGGSGSGGIGRFQIRRLRLGRQRLERLDGRRSEAQRAQAHAQPFPRERPHDDHLRRFTCGQRAAARPGAICPACALAAPVCAGRPTARCCRAARASSRRTRSRTVTSPAPTRCGSPITSSHPEPTSCRSSRRRPGSRASRRRPCSRVLRGEPPVYVERPSSDSRRTTGAGSRSRASAELRTDDPQRVMGNRAREERERIPKKKARARRRAPSASPRRRDREASARSGAPRAAVRSHRHRGARGPRRSSGATIRPPCSRGSG